MRHLSRSGVVRATLGHLTLVLLPALAVAQDAAAPDTSVAPEVAPESEPLAEVVVHSERQAPSRGAGDVAIELGKLAAVPRSDAASLLRLAPGVLLTREGGLGHPYQIFLRGFDAREGQDIEFSLEGMPINEVGNPHGNGLADTHFIIPELVRALRVVEGPFAPQQGNFAVAGSARYELGLDEPGLSLRAMAGSFDTRRLLLTWRPDGASEHAFGGAELFSTRGFGDNRDAERATAMAGYELGLGEGASLRVLATSYASHYGSAGLVRLDDVGSGRLAADASYDATQGGDSSRHSLLAHVEGVLRSAELSQSAFVTLRGYRLRENLTGYLLDPQQTWQSPHGQRGDLIDQRAREVTLGAHGSARQRLWLAERAPSVELGYSARYDSVEAVQQRNRAGTHVPYRTDLALASQVSNIGLYVDADVSPLAWLTLRGGVRAELFQYQVENRCALTAQTSFGGDPLDTECFASDRLGYRSPDQTAATAASLVQPRASLLVAALPGLQLGASYGRGARSIDPQYINQDLAAPFAVADAVEVGATFASAFDAADVTLRTAAFRTHVDKDLFFNETEGRNTLASGTTRSGGSVSARATGTFWDIAAHLTLVRATFDDTGLAVPYAPGLVARADGVLFGALPLPAASGEVTGSLAVGASFIGARPLPLGEASERTFLVDAGATLGWRALSLGLIASNLLDRRYWLGEYNYVSDFRSQPYPTRVAARHGSAGEPRALYATLSVTFGAPEASP
ncbi:MAG TPA: TonB-dependent receptor plug domain-containing protein [Polyangiaceae bacterium]|nr:TonB-dependent receptor plug domain-containing protein [Polyangiaceae bacterium]